MPTREEIEARKTPRGGWTKAQLAEWGVPWPPPKGWRRELEAAASDRLRAVKSYDDLARELLKSICGTMVDEDAGAKLIREALQDAFDLGFKAAGGEIFPIVTERK